MQSRRRMMIGVLVCGVALVSVVVEGHADPWRGEGRGDGGWQHTARLDEIFFHKSHMMLRHEEALGLSEEQTERIQVIMAETRKRLIRDEAEIDVLHVDLMRELRKPTIDVQMARSVLDKQYEVKKGKAVALVQSLADLKATLTPEQYATLKELYRKSE